MTNAQQVEFLKFCRTLNEKQINILHSMLEELNSERMNKNSGDAEIFIKKSFEDINQAA